MALLRIDISSLRDNSNDLQKQITALQNMNARLAALITRIGDSWEGDSSAAYINTMRRYQQQAEKMVQVLSEFKSYVDNAAVRFETIDNANASRIRKTF